MPQYELACFPHMTQIVEKQHIFRQVKEICGSQPKLFIIDSHKEK
jgi:hypothetical protein